MPIRLLCCVVIFCWASAANAVDLRTAYQAALQHDPTYQQAVATYLENKEVKAQALAILLPQFIANAGYRRENQTTLPSGNETFNVRSYNLTLNQQIFNLNLFHQFSSARYVVRQAAATLSAEAQDLEIRVAQAYFSVLEAKDILLYTKAQQTSVYKALDAVKTRYKVKHATITAVNQAQASYDSIRARYYGAQIDLQDTINNLSRITSVKYKKFARLKEPFPLVYPKPSKQQPWVMSAKLHNIPLIAARYGIDASREQIKAQMGNFLPNASIVGQYGQNSDPQLGGLNPNIRSKSIGIDINLPIFTGGSRFSQIREAKARLDNADAQMKQALLGATAGARSAFSGVVIGIDQIKEGRLAVKSNRLALANTQEGYLAGSQTILDVLEQERLLFVAQTAYSQDRFRYLLNLLLLKQAAGSLKPQDLYRINGWLR